MAYSDLIFDLYGTLVDIRTEEDAAVWEKTALYLGYHGAHYSGKSLERAFRAAMAQRQAAATAGYECYPDIPVEQVMAQLLRAQGVTENADALGFSAAQLFRVCSTRYIRLYDGVLEALAALRQQGAGLWLLSNAQRTFTAYELRLLGLENAFDGIYISSDFGCRKPDPRFFRALLEQQHLDVHHCLMIGNDRRTDIAGARAVGLDTLYMHTNITPPGQKPADPALRPDIAPPGQYEFQGSDWSVLIRHLQKLCPPKT